MEQIWGKGEVSREFWWENLRERDHFAELGAEGRIRYWSESSRKSPVIVVGGLHLGASG